MLIKRKAQCSDNASKDFEKIGEMTEKQNHIHLIDSNAERFETVRTLLLSFNVQAWHTEDDFLRDSDELCLTVWMCQEASEATPENLGRMNPEIPLLVILSDPKRMASLFNQLVESGFKEYLLDIFPAIAPLSHIESANLIMQVVEKRHAQTELDKLKVEMGNLRAQTNHFNDSIRLGIVLHDKQGLIVYVNNSAARIFKRPPGEMLNKTLVDPIFMPQYADGSLVSQANHPSHIAVSERIAQRGSAFIMLDATGEKKWVELRAFPLPGYGNNNKIVACTTLRDVNEVKRVEKEHKSFVRDRLDAERKMSESLQLSEEAARLASLGVMAAGFTHELNQPLNAIQVHADTALYLQQIGRVNLPESITNIFKGILEGSKRIDGIIKHVRSYWSSPQSQPLRVLDLNESIRSALTLTARKVLSHSIKMDLNFTEEALPILANVAQLEQIVINLLNNAVYSLDQVESEDKQILISTGITSELGTAKKIIANHPVSAYFQVEDNGIGLPTTDLTALFDPFRHKDHTDDKAGLGLAIVNMFVGYFNGAIHAENNPDGGATFRVAFPLVIGNITEK